MINEQAILRKAYHLPWYKWHSARGRPHPRWKFWQYIRFRYDVNRAKESIRYKLDKPDISNFVCPNAFVQVSEDGTYTITTTHWGPGKYDKVYL